MPGRLVLRVTGDGHRNLETARKWHQRTRCMNADRRFARGKPAASRNCIHDRSFAASDRLFSWPAALSDDGPYACLLRDDLDLSCARHRRRLHIVHRNEPNGNLPQTWCFPLLQEWPLSVKAGSSLIVAAHIFRQSKQRRSARQRDIAFDAGLGKATAGDPADLD